MSFHPHTRWFQLAEAISMQNPALGAHVCMQHDVGDRAAHLLHIGGTVWTITDFNGLKYSRSNF